MADKPKKGNAISRRGLFPLLGSSLLLPFIGNTQEITAEETPQEEEYKTLLKPDGTIVKVKASAVKNSKVIKKNIPNSTFLQWLGKKF